MPDTLKNPRKTEFSRLREQTRFSIGEIADYFGVTPQTVYRWERGGTRPAKLAFRELRIIADAANDIHELHAPAFRFVDLFAGIGGMRRGFEAVGGRCIFTSECDIHARTTYQANFPCDHAVAGDITEISPQDVPPYDVLVAGLPCQPFSLAGVSKKNSLNQSHGFHCDTHGTLFFDVARLLEVHRPAAFLLENVKNLLSHDRGKTFAVIRRTLEEELGYTICFRVIDAKGWVPQHRERIFIAGFRSDTGFSFDDFECPDPVGGPKLGSILHPEDGSETAEPPFTDGENGQVSDKYTLSPRLWQYLQDYRDRHRAKGNGFGFDQFGPDDIARTLSARYHKDGSEILITQPGIRPRRLTPRECARLMGFDEPGRQEFRIPVSDTQAYRQFGNAVVVPVVRAIARYMLPSIIKAMRIPDPLIEPELPLEATAVTVSAVA